MVVWWCGGFLTNNNTTPNKSCFRLFWVVGWVVAIKDDIEIETEANVYEPYEEYVKQVKENLLGDIFDEVEYDMNVGVPSV